MILLRRNHMEMRLDSTTGALIQNYTIPAAPNETITLNTSHMPDLSGLGFTASPSASTFVATEVTPARESGHGITLKSSWIHRFQGNDIQVFPECGYDCKTPLHIRIWKPWLENGCDNPHDKRVLSLACQRRIPLARYPSNCLCGSCSG